MVPARATSAATLTHGDGLPVPAAAREEAGIGAACRRERRNGDDSGTRLASEFVRIDAAACSKRTCKGSATTPRSMKGELLLTTIEGIQAGGENGAVLVPGKPDESPLRRALRTAARRRRPHAAARRSRSRRRQSWRHCARGSRLARRFERGCASGADSLRTLPARLRRAGSVFSRSRDQRRRKSRSLVRVCSMRRISSIVVWRSDSST
jgi:hypothetical protein